MSSADRDQGGADRVQALLADLEPALVTIRLGRVARGLSRTTSTMTDARDWAAAGAPDGALVVAASQSEGRGRRGRTWTDHPGASLLCSVVLRTDLPTALIGLLPIAAGVAAASAIESAAGVRPELKWPNDVQLAGRKVGGILVETHAASESIVVGLGMNIGREAVPPDLADVATSLETAAGRAVAPAQVLAGFLNALESLVDGLAAGDGARPRHEWEARMAWRGLTVTAAPAGDDSPPVSGVILGLAGDGSLRLGTTTGEMAVYAGDVSLHRPATGARAST